MENDIQSFVFRSLPMLMVLFFSLITVAFTERWIAFITMLILDMIGIWWLYANDRQMLDLKKDTGMHIDKPVNVSSSIKDSIDMTLYRTPMKKEDIPDIVPIKSNEIRMTNVPVIKPEPKRIPIHIKRVKVSVKDAERPLK